MDGAFDSVFRRCGEATYEVDADYWGLVDSLVVKQLAASEAVTNRLLAGELSAFPFLDGGVVICEQTDPDAWDDDDLPDGIWVIGDLALLAVCDVLQIPRPDSAGPDPGVLGAAIQARRLVSEDPQRQVGLMITRSGVTELQRLATRDWLGCE